jgi:hypothetical protein
MVTEICNNHPYIEMFVSVGDEDPMRSCGPDDGWMLWKEETHERCQDSSEPENSSQIHEISRHHVEIDVLEISKFSSEKNKEICCTRYHLYVMKASYFDQEIT